MKICMSLSFPIDPAILVSSANDEMYDEVLVSMSAMRTRNRIGPRTVP